MPFKLNRKINFKFLLKLFTLAASLLFVYFVYELFSVNKNFPKDTVFIVESGESEDIVINKLYDQKYINNKFIAKVYSRISFSNYMQIGKFSFEKPLNIQAVIYELHQKPKTIKVTIPEGFTKQQIADRLDAALNVGSVKKFDSKYFLENSEEGYIFPETYAFQLGATTKDVLKDLDKEYKRNINKLTRKPSKEEMIISSMLQREVKGKKDMGLVSGIIQNRLDIGMALQIDATVLYGQGAWKSRVLYKDLKSESDYNTYKNKGLPIGPISNPGEIALEAAMNPTKSKYLFYLTGRDGVTYFAETGTQHIRNINLYLR